MQTARLSENALVELAGLAARHTGVHHVTLTMPTDDLELQAAADDLGIELSATEPYWIGATVEAAGGTAHYIVGQHGESYRAGGLSAPDWSFELLHARSRYADRTRESGALVDRLIDGSRSTLHVAGVLIEQRDDERIEPAATRIVDAIEDRGADLLEVHGELVTLPAGQYGTASFGLMNHVLSRLEQRIASRRVAS